MAADRNRNSGPLAARFTSRFQDAWAQAAARIRSSETPDTRPSQRVSGRMVVMTDVQRPPIRDWETDLDHTHPDYAASAPEVWEELREKCPVAHSDRYGGMWTPVNHA